MKAQRDKRGRFKETRILPRLLCQIIRKYKTGKSIRKLAKEYGYGEWVVRKHLVSNGIAIRPGYSRVYFSEETYRKVARKLKGRTPPNKKYPDYWVCQYCGKIFLSKKGKIRKFCSRECYLLAIKEGRYDCLKQFLHHGKGKNSPHWRGGISYTHDKRITIYSPNHPFATKRGYVRRSRLVMEDYLRKTNPSHPLLVEINGEKYLRPEVVVHHEDNDPTNDTVSNLKIFASAGEHRSYHRGKRYHMAKGGKKDV